MPGRDARVRMIMPMRRVLEPFDDSDWIFESRMDVPYPAGRHVAASPDVRLS